jgi:hypothetical protein
LQRPPALHPPSSPRICDIPGTSRQTNPNKGFRNQQLDLDCRPGGARCRSILAISARDQGSQTPSPGLQLRSTTGRRRFHWCRFTPGDPPLAWTTAMPSLPAAAAPHVLEDATSRSMPGVRSFASAGREAAARRDQGWVPIGRSRANGDNAGEWANHTRRRPSQI